MLSYEVSLTFIFVMVAFMTHSLNLIEIVAMQHDTFWLILPLFPTAGIFFITMLAETNRAPFYLPEGESELSGGYNVEYAGIYFALFFLAEYNNIIVMSTLFVLLFLGG